MSSTKSLHQWCIVFCPFPLCFWTVLQCSQFWKALSLIQKFLNFLYWSSQRLISLWDCLLFHCLPMSTSTKFSVHLNVSHYILSTIAFIPWGLSLASLCALTFERYMSVIHPITHRNHFTKRKFVIYVCCVVLVTFIIVPLATASATFYYIFCAIYLLFLCCFIHFAIHGSFVQWGKDFRPITSHVATKQSQNYL